MPRMADPRCQLSAQELIYAASALRAEARRAERQAIDPQFESCRTLFENSARAYDGLATKLDRIAAAVNASPAVSDPQPQQGSRPMSGRPRQGR